MKFTPLFKGHLVRLGAPQPEDHAAFARWTDDDEYLRLMDNDPARPLSPEAYAQWEQGFSASPDVFHFRVRTLAEDHLIGMVILGGLQWTNRTATLGVNIGDPDYRGKGYGTDAMRLILNYAFLELNLHRVTSSTISYNTASIRAHEKVGFKREGVQRESIQREGQFFDVIYLGLLRREWEELR